MRPGEAGRKEPAAFGQRRTEEAAAAGCLLFGLLPSARNIRVRSIAEIRSFGTGPALSDSEGEAFREGNMSTAAVYRTGDGLWHIPSTTIAVGRPIGRGSFGQVFEGTYYGEAIAAKQLLAEATKEALEEFLNEARLQKSFPDFGFFPKLHGVCVDRELPLIVMERMECKPRTVAAKEWFSMEAG